MQTEYLIRASICLYLVHVPQDGLNWPVENERKGERHDDSLASGGTETGQHDGVDCPGFPGNDQGAKGKKCEDAGNGGCLDQS